MAWFGGGAASSGAKVPTSKAVLDEPYSGVLGVARRIDVCSR